MNDTIVELNREEVEDAVVSTTTVNIVGSTQLLPGHSVIVQAKVGQTAMEEP